MKNGFTLIELLVVVLVIGILSAVALPQYRVAVARARYVQLITLVESIQNAQEIYYMSNGHYSEDFAELDISMPAGATSIQPGRILYPGGNSFYFQGSRIIGANYTTTCNHYEVYFDKAPEGKGGRRFCWAAAGAACDVKLGEKVCKSVTGKQTPDAGGNYLFD